MTSTKHLHKGDRRLWRFVEFLVRRYSVLFGLELKRVIPMEREYTKRFRGLCSDEGVIRICVRTARNGRWNKKRDTRYEIFQVVAHELAHLKHFDHGEKWHTLYVNILARMTADEQFKKLCKIYGAH
jgi:predicted metal-dependent hydrolase